MNRLNGSSGTSLSPAIRTRARGFLLAVCLGLFVASALALLLRPSDPTAPPTQQAIAGLRAGQPAPDFTLSDLGGRAVHLAALRGRPVLLNFWSPTCAPCRAEMSDLQRAWHRVARPGGPLILGIDASADDRTAVERYARAVGAGYPLLLDPYWMVTMADYHVANIPISIAIDRRGRVAGIHFGPMTADEVVRELRAL